MHTNPRSADYLLKNAMQKNGCYAPFMEKMELLKLACEVAYKTFHENGMYLEFGVYRGHTINALSKLYPQLHFFGFDSFEGLPEDWRPEYKKGAFKHDIPDVNPNVTLIIGYFDYTLPVFANNHDEKVAFINMDCDLYSSTRTVLEVLSSKLAPGSVIFFDELLSYIGFENGEFKALNEFIQQTGKNYQILGYSIEQVAIQII